VVDRGAGDDVHLLKVVVDGKDAGDVGADWRERFGQECSGDAAADLGDDGGGTQVFRWQARLG
jgi:hypothetical protein